jgi:hypothetical protein
MNQLIDKKEKRFQNGEVITTEHKILFEAYNELSDFIKLLFEVHLPDG